MSKRAALVITALGTLAAAFLPARQAAASPIGIYVRWVGDNRPERQPDGAQMRYCDWVSITGQYLCVANTHPIEGVQTLSEFEDPQRGFATADIDGDGRLEYVALDGSQFPGTMGWQSGQFDFFQGNNSAVFVTHEDGRGFPALPRVLGLGVGHTTPTAAWNTFVAFSADGATLTVEIRDMNGVFVKRMDLLVAIPEIGVVAPGDPLSDALGFIVDDDDGDGVDELMVLHKSALPEMPDEILVSIVDVVTGQRRRTVILASDPFRFPTNADITTVAGFARAPIGTPVPVVGVPPAPEWVVLMSGRSPISDPGNGPSMYMFRYTDIGDNLGTFISPVLSVVGSPSFSGAEIMGIASFAPRDDASCNGVDDDGDGQIDEDFLSSQVPHPAGRPNCAPCQRVCNPTTHQIQFNCLTNDAICDHVDDDCDGQVDENANFGPDVLDGSDNDCNYTIDDGNAPRACAPGQQDWWCCPTGDLRFNVNQLTDTLDGNAAAQNCQPIGVAPAGATCNLRGVVRVAEQLRQVDGVRQACRVRAELAPGTHALQTPTKNSFLNFGGGNLTIVGTSTDGPTATVIEPAAGRARLMRVEVFGEPPEIAARGEHPPQLTVQNVWMRNGQTLEQGQQGGAAIRFFTHQPGGTLTIEDSFLDKNDSDQQGGAVQFWAPGSLVVRRSLFRNNNTRADANGTGGAISADLGANSLIESSTFARNFAKVGSAIHLVNSTGTLLNNTVSMNGIGRRGAVGLNNGNYVMRFNTIVQNNIAGDDSGHRGLGLHTESDATLTAYGNLIAQNPSTIITQTDPTLSYDCTLDGPVAAFGKNLIGASAASCAKLGAPDGVLIGSQAARVDPRLTNTNLPNNPNDILCPPPVHGLVPVGCTLICSTAKTAADCIHTLALVPPSPAIAAFGSGASPTDLPNTCPLLDQRTFMRPNANCTLGAIENNTVAKILPNGDAQFTITLPGPAPAYVEAFVKQNGVQNVTGDIRASQVANPGGTFTYKRVVSASRFHNGDLLDARFYYYRTGQAGVFVPGPSANAWYPTATYRQPITAPYPTICKQSNGDMRFQMTFGSRQAYVEAFVQQNGVQTVAGQITTPAVNNMNGTFTYTRTVAANRFRASEVVRARFYHYERTAPGTFRPGPSETLFYPSATYASQPACPP